MAKILLQSLNSTVTDQNNEIAFSKVNFSPRLPFSVGINVIFDPKSNLLDTWATINPGCEEA